jgi:hypothetical protein
MSQQTAVQIPQQSQNTWQPFSGVLQRKCACGQHTIFGAQCSKCRKKRPNLRGQTSQQIESSELLTVNPDVLPSGSGSFNNTLSLSTNSSFEKGFSRVPIKNTLPVMVQPKLKINRPGDKYEREADRVAEIVMRMPDSAANGISTHPEGVQRKCSACSSGKGKCSKCAGEEEKIQRKPLAHIITPLVQRRESNAAAPGLTPQIASQINSLRGGGQPLPETTRAFFEPRFGVDFSGVRVHTDRQAIDAAGTLGARAYTIGNNIAFGRGQYHPETSEGRKLLGHELTHVLQQQRMPGYYLQMSRLLDYKGAEPDNSEIEDTNEYKSYTKYYNATPTEAFLACNLILQALRRGEHVDWKLRANEFLMRARQALIPTIFEVPAATQKKWARSWEEHCRQRKLQYASQHHVRVEQKAWIPTEKVADPEGDGSTYYGGDNHEDYDGSYRVLNWVEFDWDQKNRQIKNFKGSGSYGVTKKYARKGATPIKTGRATKSSSRSASIYFFKMSFSSRNPLADPPIISVPKIDSELTAVLWCGQMAIKYTTDRYPSHGIRVFWDGNIIDTKVVRNVWNVPADAIDQPKAAGIYLLLGLSHFDNTGDFRVLFPNRHFCPFPRDWDVEKMDLCKIPTVTPP